MTLKLTQQQMTESIQSTCLIAALFLSSVRCRQVKNNSTSKATCMVAKSNEMTFQLTIHFSLLFTDNHETISSIYSCIVPVIFRELCCRTADMFC